MKRLSLLAGLMVLVGGTTAWAQCYRGEECAGSAVCTNLECVQVEGLVACGTTAECEYGELCHDGFCKEDGVTCFSELGDGVVRLDSGEVTCVGGLGMGWSAGFDPDAPVQEPPPDSELYAQCVQEVNSCDPPPVPAEECSTADLVKCEAMALQWGAVDAHCAETWGTPVSSGDIMEPPPGEPEPAPMPVEVPVDPSPWEVVDCCDSLALEREEELTDYTEFIECLAAVDPSDCDGAIQCEAEIWGEPIGLLEEGSGEYDGNATGEDVDTTSGGRVDSSADDDSDSGGCSVANVGTSSNGSLLQLVFSLL